MSFEVFHDIDFPHRAQGISRLVTIQNFHWSLVHTMIIKKFTRYMKMMINFIGGPKSLQPAFCLFQDV